jgi:hypothetical protein
MSLSAEQRQVLELLAGSPRGCTKGRLLADGFTVDTLADLVHAEGRSNDPFISSRFDTGSKSPLAPMPPREVV